MAKSGLRHIALKTRDLKNTEQFYTKVLGLEVAFRVPPGMVFLRTPGTDDLLNFVRTSKRVSALEGLDHIGFKVTPAGLKQIEKRLTDNRVAIAGRRGRSAIYIRDSNGYRIEYYCD